MRLVKDNNVVEVVELNVISAFKEAGYIEACEESKPIKAETPKRSSVKKTK